MDPKLRGSIERIATVYLTYLVTKYGGRVAGLDSIIPDLIIVFGSGASFAYGLYVNRKAGLLADAASVPEVRKIELSPIAPDSESLNKATPTKVVIGNNH
jgi:hypothetical protein